MFEVHRYVFGSISIFLFCISLKGNCSFFIRITRSFGGQLNGVYGNIFSVYGNISHLCLVCRSICFTWNIRTTKDNSLYLLFPSLIDMLRLLYFSLLSFIFRTYHIQPHHTHQLVCHRVWHHQQKCHFFLPLLFRNGLLMTTESRTLSFESMPPKIRK